MTVDHVIIVCLGCRRERKVWLDTPLTSAEALIEWMKTGPTTCGCGATHCDIKAHLVADEEPRNDEPPDGAK